jgi:tetratricopeptide (TPR) repeat protein
METGVNTIDASQEFQQAQAFAAAGHFDQAAMLCERLLQQEPNQASVLHLCGVSHLHSNQVKQAVTRLRSAALARADDPTIWFDLGLAQQAAEHPTDAEASYYHVISLKPDHAGAWSRLTAVYRRLARWDEAAKSCRRAIELAPNEPELDYALGNILLEQQQWREAAASFRHALAKRPRYPDAFNGLGQALKKARKYEEARSAFEQALALRPRYLEALFNLGTTLQALEHWSEAALVYKTALEIVPSSIEVLGNLGNSLWSAREFAAAAAIHRKALALRQDYAPAHNSLGNALLGLKRFAEAKAEFEQALALSPNEPNTLCNLGNVFLAQNQIDKAIGYYQRALQHEPGFRQAVFNEGLVLLLKGDLRAGLPHYELRWVLKQQALEDQPPRENWQGDLPVDGKTLLVCCEQGLGDTLQFLRYVPLLKARSAKVILRIQETLRPLLLDMPDVTIVSAKDDELPAFDHYCLLLSLPLAFGTDLTTIPNNVPYVQAPATKAAYWRYRLDRFPGKKIGIVCSGNPQHKNDYNRSCPLAAFKPLAAAAGNTLFLLQKEIRPTDTAVLADSPEFINLSAELNDFTDTAAIVANLDLVIAVDTSVVHLTGAMGKPVWVVLPFAPDWRWMLDRSDSPWYPSMRLFRQPKPDDWASVMAQVTDELLHWGRNPKNASGGSMPAATEPA